MAYHRIDIGKEERDTVLGGRYLDRMEKRSGEWRIAERTMLYDWTRDDGTATEWSAGLMGAPFSGGSLHRPDHRRSQRSVLRCLVPLRSELMIPVGALSDKIAVVTGASRGIGKGVALALAEAGATVYVTGRTVTPASNALPGTVGETAAECDRRGGKGIAVQVDHAVDEQVAELFGQVEREQGRLDILVNNAFALPDDLTEPRTFLA